MECGSEENLTAHHKHSFAAYLKFRYQTDNIITLCRKCHDERDGCRPKQAGAGEDKQMSTQELTTLPSLSAKAQAVICTGDLGPLSAEERVVWYRQRCDAAGLDWRSEPFQYTLLNGKLKLYATKTAAEQVGENRGISTEIVDERQFGDAWRVKVRASYPGGRFTESTGAVFIKGLAGEAYCNALMKAETKAKRRAVLSLTGLGMLDETEVDDIPGAPLNHQPADTTTKDYSPHEEAPTQATETAQEAEKTADEWKAEFDRRARVHGYAGTTLKELGALACQMLGECPAKWTAEVWKNLATKKMGQSAVTRALEALAPKEETKPAEAPAPPQMTPEQDAAMSKWMGEDGPGPDRVKFSEAVGRELPCNEVGFGSLAEEELSRVNHFLNTGTMPREKGDLVGAGK